MKSRHTEDETNDLLIAAGFKAFTKRRTPWSVGGAADQLSETNIPEKRTKHVGYIRQSSSTTYPPEPGSGYLSVSSLSTGLAKLERLSTTKARDTAENLFSEDPDFLVDMPSANYHEHKQSSDHPPHTSKR
mmetsp:Transcript_33796/g.40842  ORF Transcript_33796/g.40842 Transcript_33796/m.40842 type:complete len:131 (-) Transcript_33796:461-853(-)